MRINHCYLAVLLLAAGSANAALQRLDDANMDKVSGAEGIGIVLDDIRIDTKSDGTGADKTYTTAHIDLGVDTIKVYADKLKLHRKGDEGKGFKIGSSDDPITINIHSTKEFNFQNNGTTENILGVKGTSENAQIDVRFIRIALPVSNTDTNKNLATATNAINNNGLPTNTYALKAGSPMQWVTVPFQCTGSPEYCISMALRLRADVFNAKNPAKLEDRKLLWAKIDGANVNGSRVDVWADGKESGNSDGAGEGLAMSANIAAYVDSIQLTNRTNYKYRDKNTGQLVDSESEPSQAQRGYIQNELIDANSLPTNPDAAKEYLNQIAKTQPYSDDFEPVFEHNGNSTGLKLTGVYADLHLGNLAYQPLSFQTVLTPIERAIVGGGGSCSNGANSVTVEGETYCPDDVISDLRLKLKAIPNEPSVYNRFYGDPNTKSNIHVRELKMGAGANNQGYTTANANGYNFGSVTIEGLRVQHLNFTTRDLKPLQPNHCPQGWTCSFR